MMLLDECSIDTAEELLCIPKASLLRYASEGLISVAVRSNSLGWHRFRSVDTGQIINAKDFGGFVFIQGSIIESHKNAILSTGSIPISAIGNFIRFPVGHPKYDLSGDTYAVEFESEEFKWWAYGQGTETKLFIVKDALLSSPVTKHLFLTDGQDVTRENVTSNDGCLPIELHEDVPHKYDDWQQQVNAEFLKNKSQSHTAICNRIARKLNTSPENLRRQTMNPKKLNL